MLMVSMDRDSGPREDNYSGLWTGAWFEHLDGPWWIFHQSWD